jgi:hypothetical protein
LRHLTLLVICWLGGSVTVSGQILLTAETGGSGSQAVAIAANRISPRDFGTLANLWAQYGYGLADRVDVFALYGNIAVFGDTQHYVGIGSNISLIHRGRHGVDVSLADNLSLPITRRDQASTVLLTVALVASRPITVRSLVLTPYGGFSALVPLGQRAAGIFTPVETTRTGIAGIGIPLRKTVFTYLEYNLGPNLRSGGIGLALALPRLARP